jgi:dTDP-4-dehydrorhamnose reductase
LDGGAAPRAISTPTSNVLSEVLTGDMDWWGQDSGIYHLTASGSTSWHEFAEAIFERSKLRHKPVLKPVTAASYLSAAARPPNSRLSNQKLFTTFGVVAPNWDEALDLCMKSSA